MLIPETLFLEFVFTFLAMYSLIVYKKIQININIFLCKVLDVLKEVLILLSTFQSYLLNY